MELGGQAPFIVFPTADLNKAVQGLMASKFRNTGQTCVCANNIMVHEDVHDEFIAKLKTTVEKELHFGDVFNGATQGAMINEAGIRKVSDLLPFGIALFKRVLIVIFRSKNILQMRSKRVLKS